MKSRTEVTRKPSTKSVSDTGSRGGAPKSSEPPASVVAGAESITTQIPATSPTGAPLREQQQGELETSVELEQQRREARDAERARSVEGKQAADLSMGAGYDRIVDHLFDLPDPAAEYALIREALSFGTRRASSSASYGELVDALDAAEDIAYRATLLLVNAKVAHDSYEIDAKTILGALRLNVVDELEALKAEAKKDGGRSKMITEADVESALAAKYPREWRDLENRRGKARRMIAALEALEARAVDRARDLRQMVARTRAASD